MEFTISKSVAVALLTMGLVASSFGGPITVDWGNDALADDNDLCPLYLGTNATARLSAGLSNTTNDGYLVQLVALQGATNFVLASATVGDRPLQITQNPKDGYFDVSSSISSSMVAAVYGSGNTPMGVVFYAGTTTSAPSALVYNNSITVPNSGSQIFALDYLDLSFIGPRTDAVSPHGWYVDSIPEPSTMMLVGLGLLGAVGLRRRHRS